MRRVALLACALVVLSACREDEAGALNADSVEFPWPFTVASGSVECRDGLQVVFVSDGNAYPLNGAASSHAAAQGYRPLAEIWAEDPDIPDARIPVGPMLRLGLDAC